MFSEFADNSEWILKESSCENLIGSNERNRGAQFSEVKYTIRIARRSTFYTKHIIMPTTLISLDFNIIETHSSVYFEEFQNTVVSGVLPASGQRRESGFVYNGVRVAGSQHPLHQWIRTCYLRSSASHWSLLRLLSHRYLVLPLPDCLPNLPPTSDPSELSEWDDPVPTVQLLQISCPFSAVAHLTTQQVFRASVPLPSFKTKTKCNH